MLVHEFHIDIIFEVIYYAARYIKCFTEVHKSVSVSIVVRVVSAKRQ